MPGSAQIEQLRPPKNPVDPSVPYQFLHEREPDEGGTIREVNTIFLTNRECPFRCLMCDLWKNTLDEATPVGAVPRQIQYALERLPEASVVKLYNSGNFFDTKAVPPDDYEAVADLLSGYDRVIVENHPKLCGSHCVAFSELLEGELEIAIGLETIHPEVLPKLNKQFTRQDFVEASSFLRSNAISIRTFLLLNPPYLAGRYEGIEWTLKSARFAYEQGARCSSIIPTRPGNGIMEKLREEGVYVPPTLGALEEAVERAMESVGGRIFADLWDLQQFASCSRCFEEREERLREMNLKQQVLPAVSCECEY
ncbi:radical SAM protein [Halalkalibaculum sp. DA384]